MKDPAPMSQYLFCKYNILRLISLFLVVSLPTLALADNNDSGFDCVKSQLASLGFEVPNQNSSNMEDLFGEYERALSERVVDVGKPPYLEKNMGLVCRLLGESNFRLRKFWPSAKKRVALYSSKSMEKTTVSKVKEFAFEAIRYLEQLYEVRLHDTIRIVIADDFNELLEIWKQESESGFAIGSPKESIGAICDDQEQQPALAFTAGIIAICISKEANFAQPRQSNSLKYVVFHEVFHAAQNQLMGFKPIVGKESALKLRGPEWLQEGSAYYFSLFATRKFPGISKFVESLPIIPFNLADFEEFGLGQAYANNQQKYGLYAYHILSKQNPLKNTKSYYEQIGLGQGWKKSFEKAYGISVPEFYEIVRSSH